MQPQINLPIQILQPWTGRTKRYLISTEENAEITVKNEAREPATSEEMMDIFRNLINRAHCGDSLKNHLKISINPHEFICNTV